MSAQKAKDLIITIQNGTAFTRVAGLKAKKLAFNAETLETTNTQSEGQWRELLEGAGVKSCRLQGSGIFKDDASDNLLKNLFFNGQIAIYKIEIPHFGMLEGAFQISALSYNGDHLSEIHYDFTFESASHLTFTPE